MRSRGVQPLGPYARDSELVRKGHGRERGGRPRTQNGKEEVLSLSRSCCCWLFFFCSFVVPFVGPFVSGAGRRCRAKSMAYRLGLLRTWCVGSKDCVDMQNTRMFICKRIVAQCLLPYSRR